MTVSDILLYKTETFAAFLNRFLNYIILIVMVILLNPILSIGSLILLLYIIIMESVILLR